MTITALTRSDVKDVMAKVNEALSLIAMQHGMLFKGCEAKYSTGYIRLTMEMAKVDSDNGTAVVHDRRRAAWPRYAKKFGYEVSWLDREFVNTSGKRYRITGVSSRSRRYPICTVRVGEDTGEVTRWSVSSIARLLHKMDAAAPLVRARRQVNV